MEKQQILEQIRILSSQGILSQEEIFKAFEDGAHKKIQAGSAIRNRLSAVFYFLGAYQKHFFKQKNIF